MNILVIYWYNAYPARRSVIDHLYCFSRYNQGHNFFYWNLATSDLPKGTGNVKWDMIIYHDLFFCSRWGGPEFFQQLSQKVNWTKDIKCKKIAMPQDEFVYGKYLDLFMREFSIDAVFSVSPPSEWNKIYPNVDKQKTRFYEVLTGYIDDGTLAEANRLLKEIPARDVDIGYRAGGRNWRQAMWLGEHGLLKIELGDKLRTFFTENSQYKVDISTDSKDTLMGLDWLRFLCRSKFTIGIEGGASILDWEGKYREKTLSFVQNNPEASREEIVKECLENAEGTLSYFMLSPRHLEAPVAKSCQVLLESNYNGILIPDLHYIQVKRDFSNLHEVLKKMQDEQFCKNLVNNAYRDIVASGKYTYRNFVNIILSNSRIDSISSSLLDTLRVKINQVYDKTSWIKLFIRYSPKMVIPKKVYAKLRRYI